MNFDKDYKKITNNDLLELEEIIKTKLPKDYRKHIIEYNGGSISGDSEYVFEHDFEKITFGKFYDLETVTQIYNYKLEFLYPKLLSIGSTLGGSLAISYASGNFGNIYIYYSDGNPEKVANSFTEFIDNLEEEGEFL